MIKKNVLVMSLGDPSGLPRPKRMVDLLKSQGFVVDVISHPCKTDLGVNQHFIMPIKYSLLAKVKRRLMRYAIAAASLLLLNDSILDKFYTFLFGFRHDFFRVVSNKYDLIITEDLFLLPLTFENKMNAKVIFDAREYYPRQNEESFIWRLIEKPERVRLCRKYLPMVDLMLTVSPGLAHEYEKEFGIKPLVFRSTPNYFCAKPTKTADKKILLVHHGAANKNRQLEKMIDVAALLDDRFTLDLYLTGNTRYIRSLSRYALKFPKVRILPPVNFDSLHSMLVGYDVGLYFLIPSGFNVTFNLPNKLFEFIQARLAVAIGPSPDMSALVRQYECGVVSETFSVESMAAALNALMADDIDLLKAQSDLAARELNFEVESEVFLNALRQFN
jgi:hypothetical protein